jgi:predicted amidohydrolase
VRVIILEGQPIHQQRQAYRIVDARTGLVEAGLVDVHVSWVRAQWAGGSTGPGRNRR